jgi:hypothetical protein
VVRLVVAESTFVLNRPLVSGDSVIGALESRPQRKIAVASADIRKLEVSSRYAPKAVRLGLMGMGIVAVSMVVALITVDRATYRPL